MSTMTSSEIAAAAGWCGLRFYTVGEATATSLRIAMSSCSDELDIRGQQCGNAENLSSFILQDLGVSSSARLLYLTGDKNRDTITRKLADTGIHLIPLQVYATKTSTTFDVQLKAALFSAPGWSDLSYANLQN